MRTDPLAPAPPVGFGIPPTVGRDELPPANASPIAASPPGRLHADLRERAQALALTDAGVLRAVLRQAFPDAGRFDLQRLEIAAARGELPLPERVRFVDRDALEGANAAYDPRDGGTVLLARDLAGAPDRLLQAVGFHYRPSGIDPATARIVGALTAPPDEFGVYKGMVEVWDAATGRWVGKAAESSFFPDSMTRDQIANAIDEALGDALQSGAYRQHTGEFFGKTSTGMTIRGHYSSGTIRSAFPVHDRDLTP